MDNLEIKTKNLEKYYKKENNNYIFKPRLNSIKIKDNEIANKNIDYKIRVRTLDNQFIQFKINTKFVDKMIIEYDETKYLIENIPSEGILINCYINQDKYILIYPSFKEECARINIFNLEFLDITEPNLVNPDKIFIINLLRRIDRKKTLLDKLIKLNLKLDNYEFIEAVDGTNPEIKEEFNKLFNEKKTEIVSSGHYGCLLSHIKAIEKAKKENLNSVMILEDDIFFDENFKFIIETMKVPKFDMLYLGGIIPEIKFFNLGWGKHTEIMGAYAYIINNHMYDIVLEKLYEKRYCVDIAYIEYIQSKYNVLILDDIVKTNLDSSDTSYKNKILIKLLDRTNIKPKEIEKIKEEK